MHEDMHINNDETLVFTIDSGAPDNGISEKHAPEYQTRSSAGTQQGLVYTAANGTTMANHGKKDAQPRTTEGHNCILMVQVVDVQQPLISMSRVCDAGHRAVFDIHPTRSHWAEGSRLPGQQDLQGGGGTHEHGAPGFHRAGEVRATTVSFLATSLEEERQQDGDGGVQVDEVELDVEKDTSEEGRTPHTLHDPGAPSQKEVDRHNGTHTHTHKHHIGLGARDVLPGVHGTDTTTGDSKRMLEIAFVCAFMGAGCEKEMVAVLVIRDRRAQMRFAHAVPRKWFAHEHEPKEMLKDMRSLPTIKEEAPEYDLQAGRLVQLCAQTVEGVCVTTRRVRERRMGRNAR